MRLTQSIIQDAPSFVSVTDSLVLSLRLNDLTSLDSIQILQESDIYSILDLSKNKLSYITEFPSLLRLKTLILSNNEIYIITGLQNLINIESLSLTYNKITHLSDLESLKTLTSLRSLYLTGNPVTATQNYRLWCIWRFPKLEILDFQRIKQKERVQAEKIFSDSKQVDAVLSIKSANVSEIVLSEDQESNKQTNHAKVENNSIKKLTKKERTLLEKELEKAETLEDMQRIEDILNRGHY